MTDFIRRAKVLAGTFVTYAVIASSVLSGVLVQLEPYSDVPVVGVIAKWGGALILGLATAVTIVRKVSLVPDDLVGLVLKDEGR